MKQHVTTLGSLAFLCATLISHGAVLVDEQFAYSDGSLITVSGGTWSSHSGTAGQVDVTSGVVNVTGTESEDVNITIPGQPYGETNLYVSFTISFSVLPTGSGGYFAHFKDTTTGFRCRVFSTTTGAASGKFRLGIGNFSVSSASATIASDLDLGVEYKVVVRFQGGTNSTMWISPTSESSMVNRADATDTTVNTYSGTVGFALRQASGIGAMTIDNLLIGTQFSDVQTIGGPPSISGLVDVSIPANSNTGPLPFTISDVETPASSLVLNVTSANPTLVPNNPANLSFGGAGENRTLTVTPAAGQQGTAGIEVVVTDGNGDKATNSFTITVGSPSISAIGNQLGRTNTAVGPIAFMVNDSETAPASLVVTATSSDQSVLPDANISIQNVGGTNRSITMTSAAPGVTTVTVAVSDGTFNVDTSFRLTAYPHLGLILGDDFSYPDGSVTANSGFFWNTHSASTGATGQTQVVNGKLHLTSTQSEDISAYLTNFPYAASGGYVLYSRFVVNFSELPTAGGSGEYFAHFKEFGTSQFRARVFATTNGAAAGQLRIAIANGGFTTAVFPLDLSLNSDYVVITRYNVATGDSTLWINPSSESSTSVSATDLTTTTTIYSYAFRQNNGIGTLTVDDVAVGTAFSDVVIVTAPAPEPLLTQAVAGNLVLSWTSPLWTLQSATNISGPYSTISGASSPYTNPISGSQQFFRLVYTNAP